MQSTAQSVLNMKELRTTCSKGLEVSCQNRFKDKPTFIKRLIKVLVARNLVGNCSWYIAAAAETTDSSESHYTRTKVSPRNLSQCMI